MNAMTLPEIEVTETTDEVYLFDASNLRFYVQDGVNYLELPHNTPYERLIIVELGRENQPIAVECTKWSEKEDKYTRRRIYKHPLLCTVLPNGNDKTNQAPAQDEV